MLCVTLKYEYLRNNINLDLWSDTAEMSLFC